MSTLYILEGQSVGKTGSGEPQAMQMPYVTLQKVTFTGTAGYSAKLNDNTSVFRLWADSQVSVEISTVSSASVGSANIVLASNTPEYFACGLKSSIYISAVSNS